MRCRRHYLGAPNLMGVVATAAAWTVGRGVARRRARGARREPPDADVAAGRALPGSRYRPPAATYLAWIDFSGAGLGDDPAAVFRERGVEVSAGPQFGPQGVGHVRLNIATSPAILEQTVRTMAG